MATYHGEDGWSIEDTNQFICWVGNNYVTKTIGELEIPGLVTALVSNCDVELTEDVISRLDGMDYDGVMSLMLGCSIVLSRMHRQVNEQGATDEEMKKIVDTAVSLRSTMLGITEEEARHEMMNDDLVFDASVGAAKKALGYPDKSLILKYEDRWSPDRNVLWSTKDDSKVYYFAHGRWYCDTHEKVYTYPDMHFGNLESKYFPLKGQRK